MKKKICIFLAAILLLTAVFPLSAFAAQQQMRGVWVATVYGLDFPKTKNDPAAQKEEYITLLDQAQEMGLNTMIVQVRPCADALYESKINPWSAVLTGTQGVDPGYDPLEFMIEETHKRGMEFYAWLNPYRVTTSGTDLSVLADGHPAKENPDWVLSYNNALFYDPANDEVKQHIADTVKEIVANYDVDGIQFDDYFYPSGYSAAMGDSTEQADQKREEVNEMIALVYQTVKSTDASVSFGVSPMGIWKNSKSDPNGSQTTGAEGYYAVCADALAWIESGTVDYIAPQIYWETGNSAADYTTLVKWWKEQVKGMNVKLYIGHAVYKDVVAAQIATQLTVNALCGTDGSIFYRMADLTQNRQGAADAIRTYYHAQGVTSDTTQNDSNEQTTPTVPEEETPAVIETKQAVVSTHKVTVNGTAVVCGIYNIDGRNYFKLRDIAMALKGTQKEFALSWDDDAFAMDITTGATYLPDGSELQNDATQNATATTSRAKIRLNGSAQSAAAFTIHDRTYFKLQDLGRLLNISIYWNEDTQTVQIDTTKGYQS